MLMLMLGNFHFFGHGKINFLGGGYNFKNGWPVTILWAYIQACRMPHPFFGAKDVCYIEKKVAKYKPFLGAASL